MTMTNIKYNIYNINIKKYEKEIHQAIYFYRAKIIINTQI